MSSDGGVPRDGESRQSGIAAAITEVSERASVLIREEIELAKTEITEKTTRLAKGAVVAIIAGVFFLTALFFVLVGCAWLLYYELPIGNAYTYFWGFFAMALILVILGVIAGILAAKAVRKGAPPTPEMAIEEARKIRETVSSSGAPASGAAGTAGAGAGPSGAAGTEGTGAGLSGAAGAGAGAAGSTPPIPPPGSTPTQSETGKGGGYGTTLGS